MLIATALLVSNASAQTEPDPKIRSPFSLGVEVGTTGIGPVLNYAASPKLNFSLSYGLINTDSGTLSSEKGRYTASLDLSHLAAFANWHPMEGRFHLTAGAVVFDHKIRATAKLTNGTTYEVGGHSYNKTQLTSLIGKTESQSSLAPYLGFGWTWRFRESGFSLITDFGVMYAGNYKTNLTGTGPIVTDPTFIADLRREEKDLADDFRFFPVIKVGLLYRF